MATRETDKVTCLTRRFMPTGPFSNLTNDVDYVNQLTKAVFKGLGDQPQKR